MKDRAAIIDKFDPPVSETEAIYLMDALWEESKRDRLRELLKLPLIADSVDLSVVEMRTKYAARLAR